MKKAKTKTWKGGGHMKSLESLRIQPTPWSVDEDGCVVDANGEFVNEYTPGLDANDPTAQLVKSAPELYEALNDAILTVCCGCGKGGYGRCDAEHGSCRFHKWRDAIASAAGIKD